MRTAIDDFTLGWTGVFVFIEMFRILQILAEMHTVCYHYASGDFLISYLELLGAGASPKVNK